MTALMEIVMTLADHPPIAAAAAEMDAAPVQVDGRADFDFEFGRWVVAHHRRIERLAGDDRWQEFGGLCETRPILGGLGNVEEQLIELPGDAYRAAAVRQFHPGEGVWRIWWLDARFPGLDAAVVGRFANGVGTFFADDTLRGRPIKVRFLWTVRDADQPQWEQAFSDDGGETWETNWVMRFRRA